MSVYPIVLTQGTFKHRDSLQFPFEERGLQFGDGVYEVIRVYQGKYYLFNEHIERLFRSLEEIKIEIPYTKEVFSELLLELLNKNDMDTDGKVYLQVTRGSAPRDHYFPENIDANIYAYAEPTPRNIDMMTTGVKAITLPDIRWSYCHIKSLNLLPNVMAKQEAKVQGGFEAIQHKDGLVTECSSSNVYLVKDGKIYTHPKTNGILHGCVRIAVEKFAHELNIPFIEEAFRVEDIANADEMFLTSSTSELTPIVTVNQDVIQNGKPGPITRKLQAAYATDANIAQITEETPVLATKTN